MIRKCFKVNFLIIIIDAVRSALKKYYTLVDWKIYFP